MKQAETRFRDMAAAAAYIAVCEASFENRLRAVCREAAAGGRRILTLAGPSCSGKTTTAEMLKQEFAAIGKHLHTISIDDFYYDRDVLIARSRARGGEIDYDSPETVDVPRFAAVVREITSEPVACVPRFSFREGRRTGMRQIACTPSDAFLFEGIQAVYPELTRYLAGSPYEALFISVESAIEVGGTVFEPREVRFLRRLVRDYKFRATDAENTYTIWQCVLDNENGHIYPNIAPEGTRSDSALAYEVQVIKPFVLEVLDTLPPDSRFAADAAALRAKLAPIAPIPADLVPKNSVFREFIGN